jgi:trehalose-6-phosphate synthase
MNLVAKEFIASRNDGKGKLVLSQFTGASRELSEAFLVNPFNREQFAEEIYRAFTVNGEEEGRRMAKMRETVKTNNIYRWAGKILSELLRFEFKEDAYETSL